MRILFMGGKLIGYRIAPLLLALTEHEVRFVINDYERCGEWYRTPRELPIVETSEEEISSYGPDLILVAFFDKILKPSLVRLPRLGAWNLHLGDAERYRGAYPQVWALRNGDREYAVTLHQIDEHIDTGPILAKRSFAIPADYTGKDLYERMTVEGFILFRDFLNDLVTGRALEMTRPQSDGNAELHYRRELSRMIDVPEDVKNQVRALTFPPFSPPYFLIGTRKFVVTEVSPEDRAEASSDLQ